MQSLCRSFAALILIMLLCSCGNTKRTAKVPVAKTDTAVALPTTSPTVSPSVSPVPSASPQAGENYAFPLNDTDAMKVVEAHCLPCHTSFRTLENVKKSSSANAKSLASATMPQNNTSWAKSQLGVELRKWFEKNTK